MSRKQVILLYSDATFFDNLQLEKNLACGAAIIKSGETNQKVQYNQKLIHLFLTENPTQAEIETGVSFARYITNNFHPSKIEWYCDLPYLEELITKKSTRSSFLAIEESICFLKQLHADSRLSFHTPGTSSQTRYHTLCHRACRMAREIIETLPQKNSSIEKINEAVQSTLIKKKSKWKLL
jgi:hypothetical protein